MKVRLIGQRHRELRIGLLKAAIRKAGLTEEVFLDLL